MQDIWREGRLPPGCRVTDVDRGVSRLDDFSPAELWALLDERGQSRLYRDFFQRRWADLAACLEEENAIAIAAAWIAWRDDAVQRMAMRGEIKFR